MDEYLLSRFVNARRRYILSGFRSLNAMQQEAVATTEGPLLLLAGAGSGKTKLLVNRYVHLVQEYGIDSANILCVTFTNKAAGEMRSRVRALIGDGYDIQNLKR